MRHKRAFLITILMASLVIAAGCRSAAPTVKRSGPVHDNVLVVINDNSKDSIEVGNYYVGKRNIPAKNVIHVKCLTGEAFPDWDSEANGVLYPVRRYLQQGDNRTRIDYIVLTKGIPFGTKSSWSVDSMLGSVFLIKSPLDKKLNPFFNSQERFSSKKFGFYLVTRLDGFDVAQAKRLVDLSLKAKPLKGLFLLDQSPLANTGGYAQMNVAMAEAYKSLTSRGFECRLDTSAEFVGWQKDIMGYVSWGSNDKFYSLSKYKSNRFAPGAIAETAVSTSARTFKRVKEGQSLIADLVESGVTGVKGYFGEPTLAAVALPPILFDRYTRGWNLAESFYAASRYILWKDIVIGDPLCAPYAGKETADGRR